MRDRLSQEEDGLEVGAKRVWLMVILLKWSVQREGSSRVFHDKCHDLAAKVTNIKTGCVVQVRLSKLPLFQRLCLLGLRWSIVTNNLSFSLIKRCAKLLQLSKKKYEPEIGLVLYYILGLKCSVHPSLIPLFFSVPFNVNILDVTPWWKWMQIFYMYKKRNR